MLKVRSVAPPPNPAGHQGVQPRMTLLETLSKEEHLSDLSMRSKSMSNGMNGDR